MDKTKLIKMLITLSMIVVIAAGLTRLVRGNSMSLTEYAQLHSSSDAASDEGSDAPDPGITDDSLRSFDAATGSQDSKTAGDIQGNQNPTAANNSQSTQNPAASNGSQGTQNPAAANSSQGIQNPAAASGSQSTQNSSAAYASQADRSSSAESLQNGRTSRLTGAALNGTSQLEQRVSLTEDFYYEPLSDSLRRYITGVSYPAADSDEEAAALVVSYDDLRYVHVMHYDFDGNPAEGELICNEYIAQDLVEIFYELYYNEYQIERMMLIDEYDGDDTASMEDNNTSCFNYRVVDGSTSLSKHAYGLAIDINPFYNPYVTYEKDGTEKVSPVAALGYADRSVSFPYKIDEEDLCCRLFKEHGFIWGGNWNSLKDYQHFQKTIK